MTFKHVKFQDSAVMRSLEKVAREKGLVKEEDLVKTASKSIDLSPTPVLLVNLLKLANGLRDKGYEDAAEELENKAYAYKQAQSLYETSKEKGEDLVDAAHPDGSHQLEDVDGDALFETILDQQLEDLKVIDKKPTGKLASSNDILKAVRVVLAQDSQLAPGSTPLSSASSSGILGFLAKLQEMFSSEWNFFNWENDSVLAFNRLSAFVKKVTSSNVINNASADKIVELANGLNAALNKETVLGMKSTAAKQATFQVNSLINFVQDTVKEEIKTTVSKPAAPRETPLTKTFVQLNSVKEKISSWKSYRSISRVPAAVKWIDDELKALSDIATRYKSVAESQQTAAAVQMEKELNEEMADINAFESKWVRATGV